MRTRSTFSHPASSRLVLGAALVARARHRRHCCLDLRRGPNKTSWHPGATHKSSRSRSFRQARTDLDPRQPPADRDGHRRPRPAPRRHGRGQARRRRRRTSPSKATALSCPSRRGTREIVVSAAGLTAKVPVHVADASSQAGRFRPGGRSRFWEKSAVIRGPATVRRPAGPVSSSHCGGMIRSSITGHSSTTSRAAASTGPCRLRA